ncbi:unnamed protein product [Linum tenue]|uniref:Uncharacterized protein n=1 Tax=Linum tenue TaxID=586396 RepID=A0AAV0HR92_9ROSI|nr:unnamed protein product [Linum tenue]CAI0387745.1 unnamed protein product [Linum tenue]
MSTWKMEAWKIAS